MQGAGDDSEERLHGLFATLRDHVVEVTHTFRDNMKSRLDEAELANESGKVAVSSLLISSLVEASNIVLRLFGRPENNKSLENNEE